MANTNAVNESLQYEEKKTLIPAAIISVLLIIVSAFIPPLWKTEVENELRTGFVALETGDIQTAQNTADILYNDKKQLYNGDVFLLKGLLLKNNSLEEAIGFFERSGKWYDHHKSWISARNNGDAYYYLSQCYTELSEPNYNKAENAINKALKDEPLNNEYIQQKNLVDQKLAEASIARKTKTIGFFEGIWTKIKSFFGVKS
jgi:tetratricopeptide (TPR) repeat protein